MKTADEYLKVYLGGNMFVETLTPLAICEFAESYAKEHADERCENCPHEYDELTFKPKIKTKYVIRGKLEDRSNEIEINDGMD